MSASRPLPRKSASNDSRDLERVIAGAVVLGADLSALSGTLQPDDFTDAGLATIVRAGLAMQAEGFGRDNATLAERLRAMPVKGGAGTWLDRIGGSATLLVLQRE